MYHTSLIITHYYYTLGLKKNISLFMQGPFFITHIGRMVICSDLRLKKCIVWVGNRMTPGYVNIHTVDAEQRFFSNSRSLKTCFTSWFFHWLRGRTINLSWDVSCFSFSFRSSQGPSVHPFKSGIKNYF